MVAILGVGSAVGSVDPPAVEDEDGSLDVPAADSLVPEPFVSTSDLTSSFAVIVGSSVASFLISNFYTDGKKDK